MATVEGFRRRIRRALPGYQFEKAAPRRGPGGALMLYWGFWRRQQLGPGLNAISVRWGYANCWHWLLRRPALARITQRTVYGTAHFIVDAIQEPGAGLAYGGTRPALAQAEDLANALALRA